MVGYGEIVAFKNIEYDVRKDIISQAPREYDLACI
jgi:hypothetical protein